MKSVLFLLILAAGITACKKDTDNKSGYNCHMIYEKMGASLGFAGYSLAEVDTIYVTRYKANTAMSELQSLDTFIFNTANYNTVTLYNDSIDLRSTPSRQPLLTEGSDFEIFLPGANARHTVNRIGHWPKPSSYYSETPCKSSIHQYTAPDSGWVNGSMVYTQKFMVVPWRNFVLRK